MRKKRFIQKVSLLAIISVGILLQNCTSEKNYASMAKDSLESGIRADSLFLGYHFGMSIQDFHSISWEMNQKGIITGGSKVEYKLTDLKSTATKEFYPVFRNEVIVRIPVTIRYDAWAPWNEDLYPEELLVEMLDRFEDELNAEFVHIYVPELERKAFVNFYGNREIRLYINSSNSIMADFRDLTFFAPQAS